MTSPSPPAKVERISRMKTNLLLDQKLRVSRNILYPTKSAELKFLEMVLLVRELEAVA